MEKKKPFFSICIPVYNVEKYLEETVATVFSQSETDYEIILVDDGSKDSSGKICDELQEQNPNTVRAIHKQNEGSVVGRCDAVLNAKGEYLVFLDADDFLLPDALSTLRDEITQTGAGVILFDFDRLHRDGTVTPQTLKYNDHQMFFGKEKEKLYIDLVTGSSINTLWSKCIKRSVFVVDPDYKKYIGVLQGDDKLLSLGVLDHAQRVVYLKKSLYGYRDNASSITNNIRLKHYQNLQTVYNEVFRYIKKWQLSEEVYLQCNELWLRNAINFLYAYGESYFDRRMTKEEYLDTLHYISKEARYREAHQRCIHKFPWYAKMLSKSLLNHKFRTLTWILKVRYRVRKLKK